MSGAFWIAAGLLLHGRTDGNEVIHLAGIVGVFVATSFAPVHGWMVAHI